MNKRDVLRKLRPGTRVAFDHHVGLAVGEVLKVTPTGRVRIGLIAGIAWLRSHADNEPVTGFVDIGWHGYRAIHRVLAQPEVVA
jgi:hypothetical protein